MRGRGEDLTGWQEYPAEGLLQSLELVWERMGQLSVSAMRDLLLPRLLSEQIAFRGQTRLS